MNPVLSVVIPAYNSQNYLEKCVQSAIYPWAHDVEVIIVDDGSTDSTPSLADSLAAAHENVRVIHKENGGHGSAVNSGIDHARGTYMKVVDSDDWLDARALHALLRTLRGFSDDSRPDMVLTNFIYDKEGKIRKRTLTFAGKVPEGVLLSWNDLKKFRTWEYFLMHSITYRVQLLRDIHLRLPEHCFYVDNWYAFAPLPHVKSFYYLNEDLYHYFIGRSDQSVNEKVMISRIDQQLRVNWMMIEELSRILGTLTPQLEAYMLRYATLITSVSSVLLVREGSEEYAQRKITLWEDIRQLDEDLYQRMRSIDIGKIVGADGFFPRLAMKYGYLLARMAIGFN